jgi:hypothetical protein
LFSRPTTAHKIAENWKLRSANHYEQGFLPIFHPQLSFRYDLLVKKIKTRTTTVCFFHRVSSFFAGNMILFLIDKTTLLNTYLFFFDLFGRAVLLDLILITAKQFFE